MSIVRGRVVSADGRPASGVTLRLEARPGEPAHQGTAATTDVLGRFHLTAERSDAVLIAIASDQRRAFLPLHLTADIVDVGDIVLPEGCRVILRFVRADGGATSGVEARVHSQPVSARAWGPSRWPELDALAARVVPADADGRVDLGVVPFGTLDVLSVQGVDGSLWNQQFTVRIPPLRATLEQDITLGSSTCWRLRIVDSRNRPCRGVSVGVLEFGVGAFSVNAIKIRQVAPADWEMNLSTERTVRLLVSATGCLPATVDLRPESGNTVDVRLEEGQRRIVFRLAGAPTNTEVMVGLVRSQSPGSLPALLCASMPSTDEAVLDLPAGVGVAGRHALVITRDWRWSGVSRLLEDRDLGANSDPVEVSLSECVRRRVICRDQSGDPVKGAEVALLRVPEHVVSATPFGLEYVTMSGPATATSQMPRVTSGADGVAQIMLPMSAEARVVARSDGVVGEGVLSAGQDDDLMITLERAGTLVVNTSDALLTSKIRCMRVATGELMTGSIHDGIVEFSGLASDLYLIGTDELLPWARRFAAMGTQATSSLSGVACVRVLVGERSECSVADVGSGGWIEVNMEPSDIPMSEVRLMVYPTAAIGAPADLVPGEWIGQKREQTFGAVPPGNYEIRAELPPGHAIAVEEVSVRRGEVSAVRLALKIGAIHVRLGRPDPMVVKITGADGGVLAQQMLNANGADFVLPLGDVTIEAFDLIDSGGGRRKQSPNPTYTLQSSVTSTRASVQLGGN